MNRENAMPTLVSLLLLLLLAPAVAAGPLDAPGATSALVCSACHGFAGQSQSNTMPILAGMAPWYFKKAIQDYAAGKRPSPEMEPYAKQVVQIEQKLTPGQSEAWAQNAVGWANSIWQDILG